MGASWQAPSANPFWAQGEGSCQNQLHRDRLLPDRWLRSCCGQHSWRRCAEASALTICRPLHVALLMRATAATARAAGRPPCLHRSPATQADPSSEHPALRCSQRSFDLPASRRSPFASESGSLHALAKPLFRLLASSPPSGCSLTYTRGVLAGPCTVSAARRAVVAAERRLIGRQLAALRQERRLRVQVAELQLRAVHRVLRSVQGPHLGKFA